MIKSNFIVFDTETGGLNYRKNPMTQYAAVILDGKTLKEIDRYETFIKPYHDLVIEKEALKSTMVSMSDINNGISLKTFLKTSIAWWESRRVKAKTKEAGRLVPVGHNLPFDLGFLNYALELEGMGDITDWLYPNFIDTLSLGKLTFGIEGKEKITLGACCERAGIKLTDAHGAMNDVEANAKLFRWFMKKLRADKNVVEEEEKERKRGQDFFEFKCGAK